MIKINSTLLSELFISPNPQPNRKEVGVIYSALLNRIFPVKDVFIDYLTAQTIDKQYELASKIIQTLCYFSNFPPTDDAIKDVLCLEQHQKKYFGSQSSFIPRDHYLHIVNLYLLGVYTFFYSSEFYNRICSENSFERRENSLSNSKIDSVKDFISSWKYFCLFHDVGYSAEVISQRKFDAIRNDLIHDLSQQNTGFRFSFKKEQSKKAIVLQSSTEIVSKIIAAKYFLDSSNHSVVKLKKMIKRVKSSSFKEVDIASGSTVAAAIDLFLSRTDASLRIVKVSSNHCLKFILPIVGESSVQVWGVHKSTGKIAFISSCIDERRRIVIESSFLSDGDLYAVAKEPGLLLYDDFSLLGYDLDYYVEENNTLDSIKNWAGSPDDLDDVFDYSKNSLMGSFLSVNDEESFMKFQMSVYSWVNKLVHDDFYGSSLEKHLTTWSHSIATSIEESYVYNIKTDKYIYSLLQNSSKDDIYAICEMYFLQVLRKNRKRIPVAKGVSGIIDKTVGSFFGDIRRIADESNTSFQSFIHKEVRQELFEQFENKAKLLTLFSNVYKSLHLMFDSIGFEYNYDYGVDGLSVGRFMSSCIAIKVKELFKRTPSELIRTYHPKHGLRIDHGFSSSMYASSIFGAYQRLLKSCRSSEETRLVSILFNITGSFENKKTKYLDDYEHIFRETVFAVFAHNLYPSNFAEKSSMHNYKFEIKDPFLYFSMLCDSLQQWNRPHSITPAALSEKPNEDATEEYNIIVKDNGIYLMDLDSAIGGRKVKSLIDSLASYLKDADSIVKEAK